MYVLGKGVPKNPELGVAYLKKSAEAGHPTAMGLLFIAYRDGVGVKKDRTKANYWKNKACDSGFAQACSL